jgi:vacuolar protein sorting-associated protein 45
VQGLSSLFLALRRRPVIRYQRNSEQARRLAESLYSLTYKQQVGGAEEGKARRQACRDRRHRRLTQARTVLSQQAACLVGCEALSHLHQRSQ